MAYFNLKEMDEKTLKFLVRGQNNFNFKTRKGNYKRGKLWGSF